MPCQPVSALSVAFKRLPFDLQSSEYATCRFGVMFLNIIAKIAGTYFAYLMSNSSPGTHISGVTFAIAS